ncbi:DUF1501 domain-containing protein [Sulfurovum sp.]|jgi:uncharacterized protein (DUF1501 family)|uniref:DUF1501 domain-containing protein n=1 Tax=Sulfurovum sp. TaxID=1969726 RepID=UPI002A35F306|nr:DUF1501 domain-containing protein [Sulfurovum sp.]MDD3592888.1 DUF1501 domain-containing protein [Sulfurovum sp.]MDY0403407.1 DUF1501 domain-containing protein [Sulfurovum sp.]
MKSKTMNRRDFLKLQASLALSSSSLLSLLGVFSPLKAEEFSDYKALVCVFLEGGNDAFNMIVPTSAAAYDDYAKIRGNLSVSKDALLPLKNTEYGLFTMPAMQEMFNADKLAIIANVGTLIRPVTKEEFEAGIAHPPQLFSHIDQQKQWMTANSNTLEPSGWAARAANLIENRSDFTNISVDGSNFMQSGGAKPAFEISGDIRPFDHYGYADPDSKAAFDGILHQIIQREVESEHLLVKAYADNQIKNIDYRESVSGALEGASDFHFASTLDNEPGVPLAKQMEMIARLISVHAQLPNTPKRQIFFARLHGFDHHDLQMTDHPLKLNYLNSVLREFQDAVESMQLSEQVTTFTGSDFGRSLVPNGNGTDHGWGGHALVMGGAVKGGRIYGEIPELKMTAGGYTSDYITKTGRVIPTTSVEQYLATLAAWFGSYSVSELESIFPNLNGFDEKNLGFI